MDEPVFSSNDIYGNLSRRARLIELIKSKSAVLMVGAGASASIYPPWPEFIHLLETTCISQDVSFPRYDDFNVSSTSQHKFLEYADKVKTCLHARGMYYPLIHQTFEPKDGQTFEQYHVTLCELLKRGFFRAITTTNYDLILENALNTLQPRTDLSVFIANATVSEPRSVLQFLQSMNYDTAPIKILHLHGKYDSPDSIVLGGKEYGDKYGFSLEKPTLTLFQDIKAEKIDEEQLTALMHRHGLVWTLHRKILWSLLATRRLVFIGFSMADPYFKKMLEFVGHDLHTYWSDTHYLILRITKDEKIESLDFAKMLKTSYGIETVFFEDDKEYKGLGKFIDELNNELIPSAKPEILTEPDSSIRDAETEDSTAYLLTLSKEKNANR